MTGSSLGQDLYGSKKNKKKIPLFRGTKKGKKSNKRSVCLQ